MSTIHFQTTYRLSHQYNAIKSRAPEILGDYYTDTSIYRFNDDEKTLTFTSERLIPAVASDRKRVLLLFSNPHHAFHPAGDVSVAIGQREREFFLDWDERYYRIEVLPSTSLPLRYAALTLRSRCFARYFIRSYGIV